jgi:polysaccharide biosynthesis/export protein
MKRISRAVRVGILLWLLLPLGAGAQDSKEAEAGAEPTAAPLSLSAMIGMEAYREVLASGKYLVGPGDEFMIYITGMEQPAFNKVMAEGGLLVPKVGSVQVGGLSLSAAREALKQAFRRVFKEGELAVELSQLRNFPVPVVGVVRFPGVTTVSGVERISEVIRKAGGLGDKGSRRNIRLVKTSRLGPEVWERLKAMSDPYNYLGLEELSQRVDLELYGITGDARYNPFIEDGDLIVVPPKSGQVGVVGAVQRGDFFDFVQGDRISDILTLAEGPVPGYDPDRAMLFRYAPDHRTKLTIPVDIKGVLARDPQADLPLEAEDWLVLRQLPEFSPRSTVSVTGEVMYPGYYVVEKNRTTLREIIERAGGFTEDASLPEARLVRERGGNPMGDPEFERVRTIPVADRTKNENQYFIMKSRERSGHMVVDFVAVFKDNDETQNINLMPGDVIVVPATPRTVTVSGQAVYPGAVVYDPQFKVWDYIKRAGGLSWRASKDIQVIKARTGEVKRIKEVDRMEPGDRIWIKEKPERDYWTLFTQTMAVLGQASTMVLLYATLTK